MAYSHEQENDIAATQQRPRFAMATIIVSDFLLEKTRGSLKLLFFNDLLYSTTFTPVDSEQLGNIFQKVTGQSGMANKCIRMGVNTKICIHTSDVPIGFIAADDEFLVREINNWIEKWS